MATYAAARTGTPEELSIPETRKAVPTDDARPCAARSVPPTLVGSYAVLERQQSVQLALIAAYNQALDDADVEMAKWLGCNHNARKGVAKLKK